MAKKIYIGEILGEVMSKVEALQVDMQNVSEKMVEVANNTIYLENLYLSSSRRSSNTFSAGDDSLGVRRATTKIPALTYTVNSLSTSGFNILKQSNNVAGIYTGSATFDVTNYDYLELKSYVNYSNIDSYCLLKIDGVEIVDSKVFGAASPPHYSEVINIDCTSITSLEIVVDIYLPANYLYGMNGGIFYPVGITNDGKRIPITSTASSVVSSKKITIASGYDSAVFNLSQVTGLSIAGWDCITWMISNDNPYTKVDVLDLSGNLIISDIKSGQSLLNDLNTIDFILLFYIQSEDGVKPALEAVSYLYLT